MCYSLVLTYIFPIVLLETLSKEIADYKPTRLISSISLIVILLVPLFYTYRDNTAYLNAAVSQQQAILYYNSLITRIRSVDGYRDELPVAYTGSMKRDNTFGNLPTQGKIYTFILYLSGQEIVNFEPHSKEFCALHLGWSPEEISDTSALAASDEVKAMPCYPDSGSIKVIDGVVVVKLSDEN